MELSEITFVYFINVNWLLSAIKCHKKYKIVEVQYFLHQKKSCVFVFINRSSKIYFKKSGFIFFRHHYKISNNGKIEITVIQKTSLPIYKPWTLPIKYNILRL